MLDLVVSVIVFVWLNICMLGDDSSSNCMLILLVFIVVIWFGLRLVSICVSFVLGLLLVISEIFGMCVFVFCVSMLGDRKFFLVVMW